MPDFLSYLLSEERVLQPAVEDAAVEDASLPSIDDDSMAVRPFSPMDDDLMDRNSVDDGLEPTINWDSDTKLRNQVQLSTYPDCIGGNLGVLQVLPLLQCHLHA